jgi:uncharacterized protein (DUF433 family)
MPNGPTEAFKSGHGPTDMLCPQPAILPIFLLVFYVTSTPQPTRQIEAKEMKTLPGRIIIDPERCSGKPVFSGTRVPVYVVLEMLANGESQKEVLDEYPNLTTEDLHDALVFARNLAEIPGNPTAPAA